MFDPLSDLINNNSNSIWDKLFQDKTLILVVGLFAMVLIMIPFLNDPGKDEAKDIENPGQIAITIHWEDSVDIDIDGWVKGPMDKKPVGWKNRYGEQFTLDYDDRGTEDDLTEKNYEHFFSRGLIPGKYYFNVHWFSGTERDSQEVTVIVTVTPNNASGKGASKQLFVAKVKLTPFQDRNVAIFRLDEKGKLVGPIQNDPKVNLKAAHGLPNRSIDETWDGPGGHRGGR